MAKHSVDEPISYDVWRFYDADDQILHVSHQIDHKVYLDRFTLTVRPWEAAAIVGYEDDLETVFFRPEGRYYQLHFDEVIEPWFKGIITL